MKRIILFAICLCSAVAFAQNEVSLVVSADGATKIQAIDNALRSAIEQTYGAFVSSNTEILNDQVVKDEIISLTFGNIKKYREISYLETENNHHWVTLDVTVSLKKLTKYAKGKGVKCKLDGAAFSVNQRLHKFDCAATEKVYENLYTTIRMAGSSLFKYKLVISEPYSIGGKAYVDITVNILPNKNTKRMRNYIINTLYSISTSRKIAKQSEKYGYTMYPYILTIGKDPWGYESRWFYAPIDYKKINDALNYAASYFEIEDNLKNKYQIPRISIDFVTKEKYNSFVDVIFLKLDEIVFESYSSSCLITDIDNISEIELKLPNTQTVSLPNRNVMRKMVRWQFFGLYNRQLLGSYEYLSSEYCYTNEFLDDTYSKVSEYSNGLFFGACKNLGLYGKINLNHGEEKAANLSLAVSKLEGIQLIVGGMFRCSSMIHGYCGVGYNSFQFQSRKQYQTHDEITNLYEWHLSDTYTTNRDLSGYLVDAGVLLHFWYMTISAGGTYYFSTNNTYFNFGVGVCF